MNEIKRYDDSIKQQLQDLPMPAENIAWAEMIKLLDKDENPPPVPFYKRWGCLLLLFLAGLFIAGGALWYQHTTNSTKHKILGDVAESKIQGQKQRTDNETVPGNLQNSDHPTTKNGIEPVNNKSAGSLVSTDAGTSSSLGTSSTGTKSNEDISGKSEDLDLDRTKSGKMPGRKSRIRKNGNTRSSIKLVAADLTLDSKENDGNSNVTNGDIVTNSSLEATAAAKKETTDSLQKKEPGRTDSLQKKKNIPQEPIDEDAEKTEDDDIKFDFAAGLSIYQPLNLNGESSVPYNFYGRKGTIADYIPAPYLRVIHKKWYLHTEFRYGAPQYLKPFDYKKIVLDSTATNYTTARFQVKKTYYQQIPLSVHYSIYPRFYIGGGMIFNHFKGALVDRNTYKRVGGQTDSLQSSVLETVRNESVFSQNHFQWLAELNYNWKRLFIGARFSGDVDPFIIYKDINTGRRSEKRSRAFNIYLRYDLWRSKQKKAE